MDTLVYRLVALAHEANADGNIQQCDASMKYGKKVWQQRAKCEHLGP